MGRAGPWLATERALPPPPRRRAQAWVEGKAQAGAPVFADVRDVARAHILAAENPAACGRYIVAAATTTPASHISACLQARACGGGDGGATSCFAWGRRGLNLAPHPPAITPSFKHPTPAGALPRL